MDWESPAPALRLDTVAVPGLTAAYEVISRRCWITHLAAANLSVDTPATLDLWTGGQQVGQLLATLTVPAGQSVIIGPPTPGIPADAGVCVVVTAGTLSVSVTTAEEVHT